MRIRTVKPEFWRSPDTAALSRDTRLLFIGLWNYVDDNGVGEDDVSMIRSDLFPRDEPADIEKVILRGLDELSARGLIGRYHTPVNGRRYLYVTNWHHQRIDKPSKSAKPLPTSENVVFDDASESLRRIVVEDSALYQGNKGPREGDQGSKVGCGTELALVPDSEVEKKPRRKPTRTQIPDDWRPDRDAANRMVEQYPHLDLPEERKAFIYHHQARGNSMADWTKAFWTWLNNTRKFGANGDSATSLRGADRKVMEYEQLRQKMESRNA